MCNLEAPAHTTEGWKTAWARRRLILTRASREDIDRNRQRELGGGSGRGDVMRDEVRSTLEPCSRNALMSPVPSV